MKNVEEDPLPGHPLKWALRHLYTLAIKDSFTIAKHAQDMRTLGEVTLGAARDNIAEEYREEVLQHIVDTPSIGILRGRLPLASEIALPPDIYEGLRTAQPTHVQVVHERHVGVEQGTAS